MSIVAFPDDRRGRTFAGAVALAAVLHAAVAASAASTPVRVIPQRIEMAIVTRPPPPPPPPTLPSPTVPPEPPKAKPPKPLVVHTVEPPPPPPPSNAPPPEEQAKPVAVVAGLSFASTVKGGAPLAVPVGNTTLGDTKDNHLRPDQVQPYRGADHDWQPARQALLSREAQVVRDAKARYPKELAEQGVEGAVVLLVEVTSAGTTRGARVARSSGSAALDQLAVDAARRFVWRPAEVDGRNVDSVVRYTYRFEIVDG